MTPSKSKQKSPGAKKAPAPATVWQQATGIAPSELNIRYCAGRDVRGTPPADERLLPFDIWLNQAHAVMLMERGIVPHEAGRRILVALRELEDLAARGEFKLDPALEDVHTNVEAFVSGRYGEDTGGYLHTARSRNDQVATDMRLYMRAWTLDFADDLLALMDALCATAGKHLDALMPGFTHYQPATPTTFAHWLASWLAAFLRDLRRLRLTLEVFDECPLGAAASFGTSWPIDRSRTAELLGFGLVQTNSLDSVRSRGEMEAQLCATLALVMKNFAAVAQDLLVIGSMMKIVKIDPAYTTGSSIMPQKRNPDFAEVTRAKAAALDGYLVGLLANNTGHLSGYNRDTQWTKYLILDALDEARWAPAVFRGVIETMTFDRQRALAAMQTGFLEAADLANYLAQSQGIPFRTTYRIVGRAVQHALKGGRLTRDAVNRALKEEGLKGALTAREWKQLGTAEFLVAHKTHIGGPAPQAVEDDLLAMHVRLARKQQQFAQRRKSIEAAKAKLARAMNQLTSGGAV